LEAVRRRISSKPEQVVETSDHAELVLAFRGNGSIFAKTVAVRGKKEYPSLIKGEETLDATTAIVNRSGKALYKRYANAN
jgi:hypothetical protein